jgi:hypothetical protein
MFYLDLHYIRNGLSEVGKLVITQTYKTTATRDLRQACYSSEAQLPRGDSESGLNDLLPLAVGLFEQDGVYSIWLRGGYLTNTMKNQYLRFASSNRAVLFQELGFEGNYLDVTLDNASRTEPEGLQNTWIDVTRDCSTQGQTSALIPSPLPSPSTSVSQ